MELTKQLVKSKCDVAAFSFLAETYFGNKMTM